ncbi:hypothetical protein KR200_002163, partial [Drosophila serrata]
KAALHIFLKATGCGKYNQNGLESKIGLIPGGARPGEFPWMVAVLDRRDGLTRYIGGGSLIAANVVLTAAHILNGIGEDDLLVRAGEWNVSTTEEIYGHIDLGVKKVISHLKFNNYSGQYDIALLILKAHFPVQANIRTVCLPSQNTSFVGRHCLFNGWGPKEADSKDYPNVLKKIDVNMIDKTACQRKFGRNVSPYLICAESLNRRASCKGDGGSPLVCPLPNDPSRFEQAGIVTYGIGCGTFRTPGVYTDVSRMSDWINYHL